MPRPSGGRRKKKGGDNPASGVTNHQQHHEHADSYHNRLDHPCCRLLQDIAQGVLSPKDTTEVDASNFSTLLRQYLIENMRMKQQQQQQQTSASTKKKRKKKKKKKSAEIATGSNNNNNMEAVEAAGSSENKQASSEKSSSSKSSSPFATTTAPAAPPSLRSRREFVLQEFLTRLLEGPTFEENESKNKDTKSTTTTITATTLMTEFVQHLAKLEKQPCQINHDAIERVVQTITCQPCRHSVQEALRHACLPLTLLTENYGTTQGGRHLQDNNNNNSHLTAFDYVAMEEGMAGPPTPHKNFTGWYFLNVSSSGATTSNEEKAPLWELKYQGPAVSSDDNNSNSPWTMECLDLWIRQGLLLGGTHANALLGNSESALLTGSVRDSLVDTVDSACGEENTFFCDCASELADATMIFQRDTKDHAAGGNIEVSTFTIMKETDEICDGILRKLLSVVLKTTRHAQRFLVASCSTSSRKGNAEESSTEIMDGQYFWMFALIDELWREYCNGLQKVITETQEYEKEVFELANAQGRIPEMFCSSTLRASYRALVHAKILITHDAIEAVREVLDTPVDSLYPLGSREAGWHVSLSRLLEGNTSYQQVIGAESCARKQDELSSPDVAIENALNEIQKWAETVHQPNIEKIKLVHYERRDRLFELLRSIQSTLEKDLTEQPETKKTSLQELLQQVKSFQEAPSTEDRDGDPDYVALISLRSNLGRGILRTISPWVRYKLEEPTQGNELACGMPFSLRRAMALASTGKLETANCVGGNGHGRVESILVGLLFRWMESRFMEWQALKAEQELLNTILQDDEEKGSKAAKKSKKKKGGKKPMESRNMEANTESNGSSPGLPADEILAVSTEPKTESETHTTVKVDEEILENESSGRVEDTEEDTGGEPSTDQDLTNEVTSNTALPPSNFDEESLAASDLKIGITDSSGGFQRAEDFLVGRLQEVLKSGNVAIISQRS